eukprot:6397450-Amphidinium_carterae.1
MHLNTHINEVRANGERSQATQWHMHNYTNASSNQAAPVSRWRAGDPTACLKRMGEGPEKAS